ncbi:MAG TPA: hypothetical protein VI299_10080 [Polyangiales bacterium]
MSTLAAYQRAMVSLAFAEDDARPHIPGFLLYREMIRARLFAMARVAFARSYQAVDLDPCFARYLADEPPSSPFIREVIAGFGAYAECEPGPPWLASMLRFETAKWRAASALYEERAAGELDFDGRLVLNPTLLRVELDYAVSDDSLAAERHTLFVYRRPDEDRVLWSRLPRVAMLLADEDPDAPLSTRVAHFFARGCERADEEGLARLADELTLAVERGIVLGTAPQTV